MYTLLNLQKLDFFCLTADLSKSKLVDTLIWEGTVSHIFGPRYLLLSKP